MYTVKDIKEELSKFPEDHIIILSSDEEGNSYHCLTDLEEMIYVSKWGECKVVLTHHLRECGYTEEDTYRGDDGKLAIVLFP